MIAAGDSRTLPSGRGGARCAGPQRRSREDRRDGAVRTVGRP